MTNPVFTGYLEDPYLESPPNYLGGTATDHFGMQVSRTINFEKSNGMQVNRIINSEDANGMQTQRVIAFEKSNGMQVSRQVGSDSDRGMQVLRNITNFLDDNGMQVQRVISADKDIGMQTQRVIAADKDNGMQVQRNITNFPKANGMQIYRNVASDKFVGMELRRSLSFPHIACVEGGYLGVGTTYLSGPYLAEHFCVHGPMQVSRTINADKDNGMQVTRDITADKDNAMQVQRTINADKDIAMQTQRIIRAEKANGQQVQRTIQADKDIGMQTQRIIHADVDTAMQLNRFNAKIQGMQITRILYNTTNLRVMCTFPSRGIVSGVGTNAWGNTIATGQNWISTSTAAGDFTPFNLNTDIVEQRWQSAASVTTATLSCDTEIAQGTSIDTLAILDHNFTSSAVVTLEGADNGAFSPTATSIPLTWTRGNLWYIAPTFPIQQYRYWRLIIADPTNSDGYLRVGTIVFGTSIIMQGECFVDEVRRRHKHFVDRNPTEGFSNASNDRALKMNVGLEFKNLEYGRGNYNNLRDIFSTARTSLKCLWIPDPQDPTRFGVFAKITNMPDETHKNMGPGASDTVDFGLEVDESL